MGFKNLGPKSNKKEDVEEWRKQEKKKLDGLQKVFKGYSEVTFKGTAMSDETWKDFVCYGSYCYNVRVDQIISDLDKTLTVGKSYTFATSKDKSRKPSVRKDDGVEIYGFHYCRGGPMQYIGHIVDPSLLWVFPAMKQTNP